MLCRHRIFRSRVFPCWFDTLFNQGNMQLLNVRRGIRNRPDIHVFINYKFTDCARFVVACSPVFNMARFEVANCPISSQPSVSFSEQRMFASKPCAECHQYRKMGHAPTHTCDNSSRHVQPDARTRCTLQCVQALV